MGRTKRQPNSLLSFKVNVMIRRCRHYYHECNSENSRESVQVSKTWIDGKRYT